MLYMGWREALSLLIITTCFETQAEMQLQCWSSGKTPDFALLLCFSRPTLQGTGGLNNCKWSCAFVGELFVGFPGSKLASPVQSSEMEKEAWLGPN